MCFSLAYLQSSLTQVKAAIQSAAKMWHDKIAIFSIRCIDIPLPYHFQPQYSSLGLMFHVKSFLMHNLFSACVLLCKLMSWLFLIWTLNNCSIPFLCQIKTSGFILTVWPLCERLRTYITEIDDKMSLFICCSPFPPLSHHCWVWSVSLVNLKKSLKLRTLFWRYLSH